MRLGTLRQDGVTYPYVVREDGLHVLRRFEGSDVGALIALSPNDRESAITEAEPLGGDVQTLPPIRPGKIVAIGLNYMDHIREAGVEPPRAPLVFAKFTSSLAADGDTVMIDPNVTKRVDWEVELAVVIGRTGRNIAAADAYRHIFGYTVANDLSARDLQASDGQWVRAKSLDGFCPLGPQIVTADEIDDAQSLDLQTMVNGEVMQQSNTREMIFRISDLIAFCSASFTLEAGDVILTGTPWGCGEFMTPRRSLNDGDVVAVTVGGLGTLTNSIAVGRG